MPTASRWITGIGIAGTCLLSWNAAANNSSSVIVYGAMDLAFERADNGRDTISRLSSGMNSVSRFGFRGTEDLGGGLKANFRMETAINADSGTAANADKAWSRWLHVGLSGDWGALDMGRMWSPTFIIGQSSDPLARNRTSLLTNMFLTQTSANATASTPGFLDNAIRYTTPRINGFWGEAMYSFGEATNSSGNGTGMNVQYQSGPLYLGYGYQSINSGTAAAPVANPQANVSHFLSARYTLGPVTLYGTYNENRSDSAAILDSKNFSTSVRWVVSGPHAVLAQYARRSVSNSTIKAEGLQLGYDYALSKRTVVYARYATLKNKGASRITLNGNALLAAGDDPSTMSVGITHFF
ncbi:porin [Hydrogenophaga sp. OTU3427]|uniref:porin n=1 Tax=Hydrogenophaga sp. OTU3427 TaxID=3043856 RepID=UPI00313B3A49